MAVETPDDLANMFHPDDFGVTMTAQTLAGPVAFSGILTTGYVGESPGSTATISMLVPRIIAQRQAVPGLAQDDIIELPCGKRVTVNDLQFKGELIIIHYHEVW